jgi:hypothetical protein
MHPSTADKKKATTRIVVAFPTILIHVNPRQRTLVPSPTRTTASATIAPTATGASAAPATSTIPPTTATGTSAAPAAVSAMRAITLRRTIAATDVRPAFAIKVRLGIRLVGKIAAALNHHRSG